MQERASFAVWIIAFCAANILGVASGLGLAALMGIPGAEDRAFALFLVGAVNGWLLCLLYGWVAKKRRRKGLSKAERRSQSRISKRKGSFR